MQEQNPPSVQEHPQITFDNIAYTPPTQVFSIFGSSPFVTFLIAVFAALWVIAGVTAFIMSVVCFKFSGSGFEKFFGLILSIILGPFYWIFYGLSSTYCKSGFVQKKRR